MRLKLSGTASLVQTLTPDQEVGWQRYEYFARIRADNGSMYGKQKPLYYDIILSKEQYDSLKKQMELFLKPNPAHEGWEEVPCVKVECDIGLTAYEGK